MHSGTRTGKQDKIIAPRLLAGLLVCRSEAVLFPSRRVLMMAADLFFPVPVQRHVDFRIVQYRPRARTGRVLVAPAQARQLIAHPPKNPVVEKMREFLSRNHPCSPLLVSKNNTAKKGYVKPHTSYCAELRAVRVLGPTAPYPAVPARAISYFSWKSSTARSVAAP